MNHTFTDDQINDAKHSAAHHMSRDWISRFNVKDIRALLDALPEPQDEWVECAFEDIQKGDRVKKVATKAGTTVSHEGVAAERLGKYTKSWVNDQGLFIFDNHEFSDQTIHYYRIPAPVQHPDPAEHPVIILHRPNGNGETPVSYAWTGQHYRSFDGQEYFSANEITDWTPGKVVEDDR